MSWSLRVHAVLFGVLFSVLTGAFVYLEYVAPYAARPVEPVHTSPAPHSPTATPASEDSFIARAAILESQYLAAVQDHYLPARRAAAGTALAPDWHHVYEIARLIREQCEMRAPWSDHLLSNIMPKPADMDESRPVDWYAQQVTMARSLMSCIDIMRTQARQARVNTAGAR